MKQPEADPSVPPTEGAPGSPAAPGPEREINNMSHSSAEGDDVQPVDHIPHNEELPKWRLYLLTFSLGLANLLVALDTSILGPAIPTITSEFRTLEHIGWYTSAYLLALMPFQLVLGRLVAFYEPKIFYVTSMLVFEVGSIICATSTNSPVFILGRAVAGLGAAGMTAGGFAIIGHTPMRERPRLMAFFTALQAVAYTSGPTMSGALTDSYLTWRFNFWVNLPLGFVAVVMVFLVVKRVPNPKQQLSLAHKLRRCDPLGTLLLISCLVLLFLALEWGGNVVPYSSPQVWGCFLGSGLLLVGFSVSQALKKNNGVIPVRLFKQRTVTACCIFSFLYGMANVTHITLLPTYLQTVHGISATLSGVYQLPITFSNILSTAVAGFAISAWGHYLPFLCTGPLIYLAGSVLLQQLRAGSTAAQYIGYQVPIGAGFGLAMHSSILAVQAVSLPEDMPVASVMEIFSQQLGRAVGISVAQNLFVRTLRLGLRGIVSRGDSVAFAEEGLEKMVAAMRELDAPLRDKFRVALNKAMTTSFIVPVAATAAAAVVTWFVERRTIDVSKPGKRAQQGGSGLAGSDSSTDQPLSGAVVEEEGRISREKEAGKDAAGR